MLDEEEKKNQVETPAEVDEGKPANDTDDKGDVEADEVKDEGQEESPEGKDDEAKTPNEVQKTEEEKKAEEAKAKEEEAKKAQDRDRNHQEAERRRAKQAEEKARQEAIELAKKQGRTEGIKAATGGMNPFTNTPIENDDDVEEYELMYRLKEQDKDPIADYPSAVKAKRQQERLDAETKAKKDVEEQKSIKDDIATFSKEHPDVDVGRLFNDTPSFAEFANKSGLIGKVPLGIVYQQYNEHVKAEKYDADEAKKRSDARRASSDGSQTSDTGGKDFYTMDELKNMSLADIEKNSDKVDASYKHALKGGK